MLKQGIILAGGKSSRMGTNKSLLPLGGKTSIEHIFSEMSSFTDEITIVANDPTLYRFLNTDIVADRYTGKGPLAGIESAMYYKKADLYFVAACDMPFVNKNVYGWLQKQISHHSASVPIFNEKIHPLAGVYKREVLPKIQEQLVQNNLRVKSFFEHIDIKYVEDYDDIPREVLEKHFFNMNDPDQYSEAKSF
ncbi:molybdenum cofactor guanylyltransferase [Virgibacillus sp. SK37]|uniref:molybdenum cofactor guanylyltransferase n=1 Tax=Virgibacillus sp. SK37 TaxID=403957 RepID=UPI0004D0DA82|nr:molybdenum cofactor guanylyltransferase [Virgibacillus sp. SK37]AIF43620.1 molybdopterin-guanine dinucleotide biosynthesis protein A [Virgibacillus sp. SK37]